MQNSLLAHIASNFISEYENVANSSNAYVLNEYKYKTNKRGIESNFLSEFQSLNLKRWRGGRVTD